MFTQYVPNYQLVRERDEGKAKIYLIPKLFRYGSLPHIYDLSLIVLLHKLLCR